MFYFQALRSRRFQSWINWLNVHRPTLALRVGNHASVLQLRCHHSVGAHTETRKQNLKAIQHRLVPSHESICIYRAVGFKQVERAAAPYHGDLTLAVGAARESQELQVGGRVEPLDIAAQVGLESKV